MRLTNKHRLLINGVYTITNQLRRHRPVWYNSKANKYIYFSVKGFWHVASSESYIADNDIPYAFAFAYDSVGRARCPDNIDYKIWLNEKWTGGTDLSVISSENILKF